MDLASLGLASLVFIAATIAIGAFFKGVTGLGLPIFAIPALALFGPVESAVIVMALPSLVANIWLIVVHREKLPLIKEHRAFLVLGFAGAIVGTWILASVGDTALRAILATWLGIYLLQQFLLDDTSKVFSGGSSLGGLVGFAAGALQGATGISAPVIAPYFHARNLALSTYAFAVAFAFALFSVAQLSAMVGGGLFTSTLLGYSILATVTTMVFVPVGVRFAKKLTRQNFDRFLLAIFVLIELKLIYDIFR